METAAHILAAVICSKCEQLLKRGPVYQQHDGAAVCGPCQAREDAQPASRCLLYETTAELLRFPCRYREEGCPATVPFVPADSTGFSHEDACEYRQYVCPVLGSNHCDWAGRRNQLLQHCQDVHPDRVLPNPSLITPDIRSSQIKDYVISAFHILFLLHTRVCLRTAKLYYAVRLFGNPQLAPNYSYTVTVQRGKNVFCLSREVLPQGLLVLQEHSAMNLSTNSLLGMLGGWDGASLSVEVKAREPQAEHQQQQTQRRQTGLEQQRVQRRQAEPEQQRTQCRQAEPEQQQALRRQTGLEQHRAQRRQAEQELEECVKCRGRTSRLYRNKKGWLCADCAPEVETCTNEGCDFQDIGIRKMSKHSRYICEQRTSCGWCKAVLQPGTPWLQHYTSCNKVKVIPAGSRFLVQRNNHSPRFLVETAAGHVLCWCKYTEHQFSLEVRSSVPCEQLHLHRCKVRLECAGNTRTYTPDTLYYDGWDWEVKCSENNFLTNHGVHVSLQLSKIE